MHLEFIGAAQTVTGSMHLLRTRDATVLLDCGLYQGRRAESFERNRRLPLPIHEIDAVVLSHAHIDHSGALPILVKNGYDGPIYATPATRDLAAVMLRDAAAIQVSDARYLNRRAEKQGSDEPRVEPLYEDDDAVEAISRLVAAPYHHPIEIAPGVRLTFLDAGHVLGSAVSLLDVVEGDAHRRVAYTGDLGRYERPILRDPEVAERADVLVCESTYGDRLHEGTDELDEDLARVVRRTFERGGKLYIPTFALERAQEVIFALKKLRRHGRIPPLPVYVDSPLTVKLTDVFRLHPECFDVETRALLRGSGSPFDFEDLRYVEDVAGSKAIDAEPEPSIVIAASGMCEAGRILHHLKAGIEDPKNTILIVGYQAQHTLGRRLVEGRSRVRIFGVERDRRAEVVVLNGFSAHADQGDLLRYADRCRERGPLGKIALVHGEPRAQEVLARMLRARGHGEVVIPAPGDLLEIA
ncbi:MBL fold metallo-hydrolase RNA specificity domain-containing protein [Sorangium sp. So ce145]|uniref:MBL fold metallo-hydrolase RNA specificity domain-containing protein n=1 Tax=Sorangium sp. So ce145 TaxID=3133285 RepID=UPI003F62DCA6